MEQGETAWVCSLHELSFGQTGHRMGLGAPERGGVIDQGLVPTLSSSAYLAAEAGAGRSARATQKPN